MKFLIFVLSCLLGLSISFQASQGLARENIIRPVLLALDSTNLFITDSVPPDNQPANKPASQPQAQIEDGDYSDEDLDLDLFEEYDEGVEDVQMVADPLYYFNYAMYSFNDFLYFYALKPVAQGYKFIAPTVVRNGVNNFFFNLLFPVRFINNLFQGKLNAASDEIGIFISNSTLGVLGFNQFAQKHLNMKTSDEDLGQTLGTYSIGDGFYLVLPILGPSTLRDALGRAGDYFLTPINYVEPWELGLGINIYDKINRTSFRIGDYEALKDASLDPYVAFRNAYIQNRRSEIEK
jgi:phospholipid-binding lipoprotein MlaA